MLALRHNDNFFSGDRPSAETHAPHCPSPQSSLQVLEPPLVAIDHLDYLSVIIAVYG